MAVTLTPVMCRVEPGRRPTVTIALTLVLAWSP
jgi:hypothetical protein